MCSKVICLRPIVFQVLFLFISLDFPDSSAGKESACNAGDLGSIPGLGRSPGEENYPRQYSCLQNSVDREVCQATVREVAKSQTRLSSLDFTSYLGYYRILGRISCAVQ